MTGAKAVAGQGLVADLAQISTLRANMFDLLVVSLFLNVLGLAMPLSLLQVYDRILPNQSTGTLSLLMLGVGTALIFESVLGICRSYITGWVGARFEHMGGCAAMERMLSASIESFEKDGSGVHLERLQSMGAVREFYSGQALLTLFDLPFALLFLGLITMMGGWLVLVPLILLLLFAYCAWYIGNMLRAAIEKRMTADDRRYNFIIEVLGGVHSVKALAMENLMSRRYERLQEGCAESYHQVAMLSTMSMGVSSFFSQFVMVAVAAYGATIVVDGAMTTGALAACSLMAGRALQPLQRALGIWTRFQTIRIARQRLNEIFKLEPEAAPGLPKLPPVVGEIEVKNVSFAFGDAPPIIEDLNLHVREGECIAVAGGNGSGKTTLMALLQGALKPRSGTVLVDGLDLAEHEPQSVRRQIAYLPQQGALFQGTIVQNITMHQAELDDAAMETAAMLGLDDVVTAMPLGYDTPVGDGAHDSMPRGIKQRIAVARALVHNPKVVLFDEANTAIDSAGDNYIRAALERMKGRATLILVTHRPSLTKLADRSFILEGGRLIEREDTGPQAPPPAIAAGARK